MFWGALAIGAGIKLFSAHKQAKSANKAADQQVAATDKGLALQEKIYTDQKAGMQPYAATGQQALGSLGALMGFPALPQTAQGPVQIPFARTPMSSEQMQQMPRPMMVDPATGKPLGTPGTLGSAMGQSSYGGGASGPPQGVGGSMPAPGPAMISVMSPDGEVGQIPEAAWPKAQAAGGRRV